MHCIWTERSKKLYFCWILSYDQHYFTSCIFLPSPTLSSQICTAFAPCINLEQLDIRYITLAPFEDQGPSLQMRSSKTPRIHQFRNVGSQTAVGRLLRAKWKYGRPVLDFSHVKTLELGFGIFRDVQLTRELFENISYLEKLEINGMFTCQIL